MLRRFAGQRHVTSMMLNKSVRNQCRFSVASENLVHLNCYYRQSLQLGKIKIEKYRGRGHIN